jgi:hypothetical protein
MTSLYSTKHWVLRWSVLQTDNRLELLILTLRADIVMPFHLSWCHALTCTDIPSICVPLDRLSTLLDWSQTLPLSRYLAALSLHVASFLPSYSILVSHAYATLLTYMYSPFLRPHVSHFSLYQLILFCYLLSTILCISQPISVMLTHLLTVLWPVTFIADAFSSVLVFKHSVKT